MTVVLGLGSNRGDSLGALRGAVASLGEVLEDMRVSSLYVTKPMDYLAQPDFLNAAVAGQYRGTPRTLLEAVGAIEKRWGRDRANEIPKGPRTLDIDIELFGDSLIRETDLVIPHERMGERLFVLVPLLELLPDSADPVTGEPLREIAGRLSDQGVKKAGAL